MVASVHQLGVIHLARGGRRHRVCATVAGVADADELAARWLTILRCGYQSPCRAARCPGSATTILRKAEANGRPLRQVELCSAHAEAIVARERARGLGVTDRR